MRFFKLWVAVVIAAIASSVSTLEVLTLPVAHANIVSGLPLLSGQAPQFKFRSTFYYPVQGGTTVIVGAYANGVEFGMPFWVPTTTTFTRMATWILTGGSAGSLVRFGIYNDNGGRPGNLLLDAGTAVSTGSAAAAEVTISQSLTQGMYWLSVVGQGAPVSNPTTPVYALNIIGTGYDNNTELVGPSGAYDRSGITGALTNWSGATATAGVSVGIAMKVQ